jgi:hypothetical protein
MRPTRAAAWIAGCAVVIVLSLIRAAVSSAAPPAQQEARDLATTPQPFIAANPIAAPAPVTRPQPPIRADLVMYYLADVRGNVKPCT